MGHFSFYIKNQATTPPFRRMFRRASGGANENLSLTAFTSTVAKLSFKVELMTRSARCTPIPPLLVFFTNNAPAGHKTPIGLFPSSV